MMRNPPWNGQNAASASPLLRLVNDDVAAPHRPRRENHRTLTMAPDSGPPSAASLAAAKTRRMEVARENHLSSTLTTDDARWVFAVLVSKVLEGGRAAVLPPERRELLMSNAKEMGLRDFDANLVIAIVQDCVRTGHERLCPKTQARLAMVREAQPPVSTSLWQIVAAAVLAGGGIAGLIIHWFRG